MNGRNEPILFNVKNTNVDSFSFFFLLSFFFITHRYTPKNNVKDRRSLVK